MIRQLLIALCILLLPLMAHPQDYAQVTWLGYTRDLGTDIHEIDDAGNAYVTMKHYQPEWSSFLFPNGAADGPMVLAKLNPAGKLLWSVPLVAEVYRIKADPNGNVYVSGVGSNIKLSDGTVLPAGSFVIKFDKNGKSIWGVVSENVTSSSTSGPVAIADDGIYWNASFYATTKLQERSLVAAVQSSPDSFVAKINSSGQVTAVYQDKTSSVLQDMVEAENGNAAFIIMRGGIPRFKVILDKNCNVVSDKPFLLYSDSPRKLTYTSAGYEMMTNVGIHNTNGWVNQGFFNIRFDKNLDVIDSVKLFEPYQQMNPDKGRMIYYGVGSQEAGFFVESPPKPYAINNEIDWLHLDQSYNLSKIADENPENVMGNDPFTRRYSKMVGDTLHMLIRRFTYYYGKTFTLNNQSYTTPSNDNFSWFWAKYVYKGPVLCNKIKAQVVKQGKEGSQNVIVRFTLPDLCPATADIVIPVSLTDPAKNQNDLTFSATITIKQGQTSGELQILVADDNVMELTEAFTLTLSVNNNAAGYSLSNSSVKFNVEDNDIEDVLNVSFPSELEEGEKGFVTIAIPNGKLSPVDISLTLASGKNTYEANKSLDFSHPPLVIPALTNSVQLSMEALNDDLLEGDEFINGTISVDQNSFRAFKLNIEAVNVKIFDPDNTYENRVFYTKPFIDTLLEGKSQSYTLGLKSPLKLQRPISVSVIPLNPLPSYVTQSSTSLSYDPLGMEFIVDHLDDLLSTEKIVVFKWKASDTHTGDYRFSWKSGYSELMEIHLLDKDFTGLGVPNTFSPNGDGINDNWLVKSLQGINCRVIILNRYGEPVFRSTGYSIPWDGRFKGKDVPVGAYYYKIFVKDKTFSGNINILR